MVITSRQNPLVARYRAAARGRESDALLLDGVHLVADALDAGITIQHAAVTPAAHEQEVVQNLVAALGRAGVNVVPVSATVMDAISPVRSSTGIVALAERPRHSTERLFDGDSALVVIGVDVQDPGNLGAIVRVAEASGATGMVAAGASADPFGWKALRGSMGSALRLPLAIAPPEAAIAEARHHRCRIVATTPRDGRSLFDTSLTGPLAILIGGEGQGLPRSVVAEADEHVTIPMEPPVESLNAAVTAALILYEVRRQRRG